MLTPAPTSLPAHITSQHEKVVFSVGPYPLTSRPPPPIAARHLLTWAAESTSPPAGGWRTPASAPIGGSAIGGSSPAGSHGVVTAWDASAAASSSSVGRAAPIATSRAPLSSAPQASSVEASDE